MSYIAGTIVGNPSIRCFDGPSVFGCRKIVSSREALTLHGIEPIPLASKEHLGILNGTAFSTSVAALVLNDAIHMALLTQVCTAMGTEALTGTRGSFDPFIHNDCRPHPGQASAAFICSVSRRSNSLLRSRLRRTYGTSLTAVHLHRHMKQSIL